MDGQPVVWNDDNDANGDWASLTNPLVTASAGAGYYDNFSTSIDTSSGVADINQGKSGLATL